MCMEDVRIGRQSTSSAAVVSVGAGAVAQVLPADPYRYSLVLSAPASGSCTYSINQAPGDGEGITFHAGGGPITLGIQEHGDLVRRAWYVYCSAAVRVAVHTSSLRKE